MWMRKRVNTEEGFHWGWERKANAEREGGRKKKITLEIFKNP